MGTLQVGGTTLGVKNTTTNKVDLSNTGTLDSLPFYACRAWVNFDGTDSSSANPLSFTDTGATNHGDANSATETLCAIKGSGNVSKVLRTAAGQYTVNFTTAMPDNNYCVVVGGCIDDVSAAVGYYIGVSTASGVVDTKSQTQLQIMTKNQSGAVVDLVSCNVAIFR